MLHLTPAGVALSTRAISKVRLQEHGADSAEKRLVRLGAPVRPFGQHPAEWINDVLASNVFRRVKHPGNHVYAWALGKAAEKAQIAKGFIPGKQFPKTLDDAQLALGFAAPDGVVH